MLAPSGPHSTSTPWTGARQALLLLLLLLPPQSLRLLLRGRPANKPWIDLWISRPCHALERHGRACGWGPARSRSTPERSPARGWSGPLASRDQPHTSGRAARASVNAAPCAAEHAAPARRLTGCSSRRQHEGTTPRFLDMNLTSNAQPTTQKRTADTTAAQKPAVKSPPSSQLKRRATRLITSLLCDGEAEAAVEQRSACPAGCIG